MTIELTDASVGARIKLRRRTLGLSQSDLGRAIGVSFQQVQKYERGSNRVSASMLVKIAAHLQTKVAALVGEGDGGEPIAPEVCAQLTVQSAPRLVEAFALIDDAALQQSLVTLARAVAAADA